MEKSLNTYYQSYCDFLKEQTTETMNPIRNIENEYDKFLKIKLWIERDYEYVTKFYYVISRIKGSLRERNFDKVRYFDIDRKEQWTRINHVLANINTMRKEIKRARERAEVLNNQIRKGKRANLDMLFSESNFINYKRDILSLVDSYFEDIVLEDVVRHKVTTNKERHKVVIITLY